MPDNDDSFIEHFSDEEWKEMLELARKFEKELPPEVDGFRLMQILGPADYNIVVNAKA